MATVITTPFTIGCTVYLAQNRQEQYWVPCAACEGSGLVVLKNGEHTCPECYGRRGNNRYRPTRWLASSPHTVGQIRVQIGGSPEYRLMCIETGVGSGSLHDARSAFLTLAECQHECACRNNIQGYDTPEFEESMGSLQVDEVGE